MRRLFRQFSFPGGIPSHVAPETPGLDPRGRRARLLARRTPSARRSTTRTCSSCCVVGDGEAETGPLATSWHSNKFLNPRTRRRGAADPAPQRLQDRQPDGARAHPATRSSTQLLEGYGYAPHFVEGDDPADDAPADGGGARRRARRDRRDPASARARTAMTERPRWPMIVLRTPKGWTGPKVRRRPAGRGHLARAPGAARRACATNPEHLAQLEAVDAQLPAGGAVRRRRRACAPSSPRSRPTASGG